MRFITEFELDVTGFDGTTKDSHKASCKLQLGVNIADAFGWKERGLMPLNGPVILHSSLEIEAFPMDKWIAFKNQLILESRNGKPDGEIIRKMIEELESFDKAD